MIEKVNEIRCKCDICKECYTVSDKKEVPLVTLKLPMREADEYGRDTRYTVTGVDVCKECMIKMAENLSEHYAMKYYMFHGVEISNKDKEQIPIDLQPDPEADVFHETFHG